MTIDEIRDRLLELAKTNRVTEEDADLLERTEVELDAAFIELSRCRDRIKRLEDAGDAVAAIIGPPGSAHWADEDQVDAAWNNWTKAKEAKP